MAVNMQPVDGLIHRLLQQNAKTPVVAEGAGPVAKALDDHVSISSQTEQESAQLAAQVQGDPDKKPGERALESHLLNLYRSNDRLGG